MAIEAQHPITFEDADCQYAIASLVVLVWPCGCVFAWPRVSVLVFAYSRVGVLTFSHGRAG